MIKNLFLASLCVFSLDALAQQGTCGTGVNWVLEDSTLTISGEGTMNNFTTDAMPSWNLYKSKIRDVIVQGAVSNIGDNAFYQYEKLKVVKLGEGVSKIGAYSFSHCPLLRELHLPETIEAINDYAFEYCTNLKELTLPQNITLLHYVPFQNSGIEKVYWNAVDCKNEYFSSDYRSPFGGTPISEVHFGANVKTIPAYLFENRGSLSNITTQGTIEYVGVNALKNTAWLNAQSMEEMVYVDHAAYIYKPDNTLTEPITLNLKEGTTSITAYAMSGNERLVKVIFPTTLKLIGVCSFEGCTSLGEIEYNAIDADSERTFGEVLPNSLYSVTFGDEVKTLPTSMFYGCVGLTELNLPKSLEIIRENTFCRCNGLTDLIIPDNVKTLAHNAISEMDNLEHLTIGEGLKDFLSFGYYCKKLKHLTWNAIELDEDDNVSLYGTRCYAPVETVVFGDKVKTVPKLLLYGTNVSSVILGKSVNKIGASSFQNCGELKSIDLPNSLRIIEREAFRGSAIEEILIPENVESIGDMALAYGLIKRILFTPGKVPSGTNFIYTSTPDCYVPDLKEYKDYSAFHAKPMLIASADKFEYTGNALPPVTFICNIPGYETDEIVISDMEKNAGEHSVSFPMTFKGEREFTVNYVYTYTVNKGYQEIVWEQDFRELQVGDRVELQAYATSGLPVDYIIGSGAEIETVDGKTYLVCTNTGNTILRATQSGDDNWLAANNIEKELTIKVSTGIENITLDNATSVDFYTIDGRRTTGEQKGLRIVRYPDGSVRKELLK